MKKIQKLQNKVITRKCNTCTKHYRQLIIVNGLLMCHSCYQTKYHADTD